MEEKEFFIQQRLRTSPEQREEYYIFPKGTMIWPAHSGRGVLTENLQARKKERKKVKGFQAWVAEDEIHLYLDKKHWQLSFGTEFGASVKSAIKRKI